jgi:hypothetical protein
MLSVIYPDCHSWSVTQESFMLSVVLLKVVMPSVVMLSVVAPFFSRIVLEVIVIGH